MVYCGMPEDAGASPGGPGAPTPARGGPLGWCLLRLRGPEGETLADLFLSRDAPTRGGWRLQTLYIGPPLGGRLLAELEHRLDRLAASGSLAELKEDWPAGARAEVLLQQTAAVGGP